MREPTLTRVLLGVFSCGLLAMAGCGLPTWSELIGSKKEEVPEINPNPPMPVVQPTVVTPPLPPPPTPEEQVAKFQAMKPYELDDTALLNVSSLPGGLEAIEELNLNGSRVTNGGLEHLAKLPNLKKLDVRNSPVDQHGAKAMGALTSLEELRLDGGEMTDEAMAGMSAIPALKVLEISNVRLSPDGWAQLAKHKQLEDLTITSSNIDDNTMAIINQMTSLKRMWINNCAVSDVGIAHLKDLDALESLNLGGTQVRGHAFGVLMKANAMKGLRTLGMDTTPLDERGAAGIRTMLQLTHLGLGSLRSMQDQHFVPMVKPLKNLETVNLSNCEGLSGGAFSAFAASKTIRHINASGCGGIDDSGLRHLQKCENLEKLDLGGTRCSITGAQALKRTLPNVEITGVGLN